MMFLYTLPPLKKNRTLFFNKNSSMINRDEINRWFDSLITYIRSFAQKKIFFRAVRFVCTVLYFTVGCIAYNYLEGWDTVTALNFSFVTISTVGYGYQSPTNDSSRIFTIFYLLFGIYFIFITISERLTKRFDALVEYAKKTSSAETDQIGSSLKRNRHILLALILAQIVCVFVGALIFNFLQPDWSFISSVYFAIETSTVSWPCINAYFYLLHIYVCIYIT